MKIIMVLEKDFPPDVRVQNEAESLVAEGHHVSIAGYSKERNNLDGKLIINGVRVYKKKINSLIIKSSVGCLKTPFYFNFWRRYLKKILKKEQFDAIHIHDLPLAKVGVEMSNRFNIPVVLDLHENWPAAIEMAKHTNSLLGKILSSNAQWQKYEKDMTNRVHAIITVVQEMKNRITTLGVDKNKITVVANTLELNKFKLPNLEPNTEHITLFYAGGITYHRGIQIAIKAIALLKNKYTNIRFWVIGSGSYESELKKLVKMLKVEDYIHFLGWKSHKEIASHLMQSDIALIPHLKSVQTDNSSPNKLYQYMYANKPILSSNCNSIKRIIEQENLGVTYKHDNIKDFADKFEYIIKNKKMFSNGHEIVKNKYSWNKSAKVLIQTYENLK